MHLIEFPEHTTVIARDQKQYDPMPAHIDHADPMGRVTCCWQLTFFERVYLLFTGHLWHTIMTFRGPVQPQSLRVTKPQFRRPEPK